MARKEDPSREASKVSASPTSPDTQSNIHWDDSSVRSACANVFNVSGAHEEIVLIFGESQLSQKGQREVQLTNRIVLSPFTAKRLLILLENTIQKHEFRYGPLETESPTRPGLIKTSARKRQSPDPKIQRADRIANFLIQQVEELDVIYDFERSFKMSPRKLLENRFLLIVDKNDISARPHERILSICERLGMPEEFFGVFKENLAQANPVDFGFEASDETCVYKVYLDFLPNLRKEGGIKVNKEEPCLMFLGFKWDALDNAKKALTKYTWYPSLSFADVQGRLSEIFENDKNKQSVEITNEFLDVIASRTTHDRIYYLDVTEEHGQRRSFDLNAYSANLKLKELYPILIKICEYFSIPVQEFHQLYSQVETKTFGHLSGGIDREGNSFLTVYFGLEPVDQ